MNLKTYRVLLLGTAVLLGTLGLSACLLVVSGDQETETTTASLEYDLTTTAHAEPTITATPIVDRFANALATAQARDATATHRHYPTATARAMRTATVRFERNLTATMHAQEDVKDKAKDFIDKTF